MGPRRPQCAMLEDPLALLGEKRNLRPSSLRLRHRRCEVLSGRAAYLLT